MRKLVTLRKVKDLKPIEDADFIELAVIDGWKCVVKKGDFEVGDEGIFFEIDSVLPEDPRWEFLEKRDWRVRTMKMRGQRSQGLLLPKSVMTEGELMQVTRRLWNSDEDRPDLSDIFGVEKHEKDLPADAGIKGKFPIKIRKTDQERIQNIPEIITSLSGQSFELTEKIDGQSLTIFQNGDKFGVCSRNYELEEDETAEWKVVEHYDIREQISELQENYALQGELIGPKIQGNYYELENPDFLVYDVWNLDKQRYTTPETRREIVNQLGLKHVPVIKTNYTLVDNLDVEKVLEMAEGTSELIDKEREGIVWKSNVYTNDLNDEISSWKAISNKFLE